MKYPLNGPFEDHMNYVMDMLHDIEGLPPADFLRPDEKMFLARMERYRILGLYEFVKGCNRQYLRIQLEKRR